MIHYFYSIVNVGVTPDMLFSEKRKIRTLNALAFVTFILSFIHAFVVYKLHGPVANFGEAFVPLIFPLCCLFVFWLHHKKHYVFVRYYFIVTSSVSILLFSLIFGYTGIEYSLFVLTVLSFLLFEQRISILICGLVSLICFVLAAFKFDIYSLNLTNSLKDLYLPNIIVVFILLSVITYIFKKEFFDYQQLLEKNNLLLHETNAELQAKKEELMHAVNGKEFLFKEIHHRVKNNLATVCSLINLESYNYNNTEIKGVLDTIRNRISTIALIHDHLYKSNDSENIVLDSYLSGLLESLYYGLGLQTKRVFIEKQLLPLTVSIDKAQNIGMLVCELVSNSVKYAFSEQQDGIIHVEVSKNADATAFLLTVKDDGKGFSKHFDWQNTDSLGYQIIHALCENLEAELQVTENMPTGAKVTIKLKSLI